MKSLTPARALLLVLLAFACLVPLAPAADAGEIVPSPPPGANTGPGGGGGGGTPAKIACANNFAYARARGFTVEGLLDRNGDYKIDARDEPLQVAFNIYPGCYGYKWTGEYRNCPVAFEVFRFYGTKAKPVQAWTVSRINLPDTCQQFNVFIQDRHPDDHRSQVAAPGAAWRQSRTLTQSGRLPVDVSTVGGRTTYMPSPPFARSASNCNVVAGDNGAFREYFWVRDGGRNGPGTKYYNEGAANVRAYYRNQWQGARKAENAGIANLFYDVQATDSKGDPILKDQWHCGSDQDFTVTYDPLTQNINTLGSRRVTGVCYVPVVRWKERYQFNAGSSTGPGNWYAGRKAGVYQGSRDTYWDYRYNGGNRYPQQGVTDLNNIELQYRATIRSEVGGRRARGVATPSESGDHNPPSGWGSSSSRDSAAYGSRCLVGLGAAVGEPVGGSTTNGYERFHPGDGAVELVVSTPEAGQVGGRNRQPANVTATAGRILCEGSPCAIDSQNGPFVASIAPSLGLNAPPGFVEGKDWRTRNAFRPPASPTGSGTWGLEFFTATPENLEYQVTGGGTADVYWYNTVGSTVIICGNAAQGGTCRNISTTTRTRYDATVALQPVFDPDDQFPVISSTSTPTADRQTRPGR